MGTMLFERFKNDEDALKYINSVDAAPYTGPCFAYYGRTYNGIKNGINTGQEDGDVYFGFPTDEKINKLVEEINEKFSNIKIVVVCNKTFNQQKGGFFIRSSNETEAVEKFNYTMFRVELNEGYSQAANYTVTLAIAQFIRIFCQEYKHYYFAKELKKDFIKGALKSYESAGSVYGNWSGSRNWSMNQFNMLDSISIMNKVCPPVTTSMPYMSRLFDSLRGVKLALYE